METNTARVDSGGQHWARNPTSAIVQADAPWRESRAQNYALRICAVRRRISVQQRPQCRAISY
ncbi:hypothetical protein [Pleurocapsa sp. FMAR1]|uniref:hypothetical protein n=1 Tax=Pleurocapsa sp. FMAR1 TaxID=3040204 RepID=UPI0029C7357B|nr:hypothetical protein [Pleurocapsa sp. FMAR1]